MHCYAIGSIDWWVGWMTYPEFFESLSRDRHVKRDTVSSMLARTDQMLLDAKEYAREHLLWDGDIHEGPFFSGLPLQRPDSALTIAWKQRNNGTTFVVSEVPLPWLGEA